MRRRRRPEAEACSKGRPRSLGRFPPTTAFPLRTAVWPAPPGGARGTVVLLQGRAEFIEKYGETVDDLRARGFAVYALDWRGQGRSGRVLKDSRKGHVVSYEDYLRDLNLFLERLVVAQAPRPIVVLAHSMGGHIVLRHRAEHDSRAAPYFAAGIVLSAPMVNILMNPAETGVGGGTHRRRHERRSQKPVRAGARPLSRPPSTAIR